MPLVRVHEASDGKLFKNYDDYVVHEEGIKFNQNWDKAFSGAEPYFEDENHEDMFKQFVAHNQDALVAIIQNSKVKRTGSNGKKK